MSRRSYAGGAQPTTLSSSVNSTATVISAVALVGWPTPANPFFAVIDRDTTNEEKILCTSVNGNDLTVLRGQDGTTARDHSAGAPFEHCHTATDADEANAHANATTGVHGAPAGDGFAFRNATQTLTNKTLDFGVTGGNTATNIPLSSVPEAETGLAEALNDLNAYLPVGSVAMFAGLTAPTGWLVCDGSLVSRTTYADLYATIGDAYGGGDGLTTFALPDLRGRIPAGVGTDADFSPLGKTGGAKTHALTAQEMPSHAHDIAHTHAGPSHTHTGPSHTHAIDHNHAAFTTASGGTHNHVLEMREAGGSIATVGKGGGANPESNGGAVLGTNSSHTHSIDVPAFTGTSGTGGTGATGASGTGNTGVPSNDNSGLMGNGQAHNNLQPYLAINFIIRALKAT